MHHSTIISGSYRSIDEYIANVPSWDVDISQLVSGRCESRHTIFSTRDFEFRFIEHTLRFLQRGYDVKPGLSFFLPLSDEPLNYLGHRFDRPTICCAPSGENINVITPDNFFGALIYISSEKLQQLLAQICDPSVIKMPRLATTYFHPTAHQFNELKAQLILIKNYMPPCGTMTVDNKEWLHNWTVAKVVPLLVEIMANRSEVIADARREKFETALEIIVNNIYSPPSITELAALLNMTARNLQYMFKNNIDMTPKQFAKVFRLNVARKRLWHSARVRGQVSDIANDLGYWHMGSFTQEFKQLFQLTPTSILSMQRDSGMDLLNEIIK